MLVKQILGSDLDIIMFSLRFRHGKTSEYDLLTAATLLNSLYTRSGGASQDPTGFMAEGRWRGWTKHVR